MEAIAQIGTNDIGGPGDLPGIRGTPGATKQGRASTWLSNIPPVIFWLRFVEQLRICCRTVASCGVITLIDLGCRLGCSEWVVQVDELCQRVSALCPVQVLLSVAEHHSNLVPWQLVAQRTGAVLRHVPLTKDTQELDMKVAPLPNNTSKCYLKGCFQ